MRDLGELGLYIEKLNFKSKEDLKKQLQELLSNSEDYLVKSSLKTALSLLESVSEEELKVFKGSF